MEHAPAERHTQKRPLRQTLFCLLLAAALSGACLLFSLPTWLDNDDSNIAFALAGYLSGDPCPVHPFINPLLSAPVSLLYRAFPAVPWWFAVQILVILLSMAAVGQSLLAAGAKKRIPALVPLFAFGVLAAGLFLYPQFLVTFTLTSACAGAAAAALVLTGNAESRPARGVLSVLFLALAFLFRNSSGYPVLCYYAGALLFRLRRSVPERYGLANRLRGLHGGPAKRVLLLAAAAVLVSAALALLNRAALVYLHADGFLAFDTARWQLLDYPVDTYAQNPALYESVGWDGPLAGLVRQWYYMDPRVTAEAMDAIVRGSAAAGPRSASAAFEAASGFFKAYPMAVLYAAVPLVFTLGAIAIGTAGARKSRARGDAALFSLGFLLGTAALTAYLAVSGRLVLRAFQLFCLPWGAVSAALLFEALPGAKEGKRALFPARAAAALLFVLAAALPAAKAGRTVLRYDSSAMLSESRAMLFYVRSHPETVFIRDTHTANDVDALTVYPKGTEPVNLLDWGGTAAFTRAREDQLRLLNETRTSGLLRMDSPETFLLSGVRLISSPGSRDLKAFTDYLASALPGARIEEEARITSSVAVYRILRDGGKD